MRLEHLRITAVGPPCMPVRSSNAGNNTVSSISR